MKYLHAYFRAWLDLFVLASLIYTVCGSFLYVFDVHVSHLIGIYLLYLVFVGAVGGLIKELLGK